MVSSSKRLLVLCMLSIPLLAGAALFERTTVRDGVRMPVEQAEEYDLKKAETALAAGKPEEALVIYENFIQEFPRSPRTPLVMAKLGETCYQLELFNRAEKAFRDLIDRYPRSPEAADAAWGLALIAVHRDRCDQAMDWLKRYRGQAQGQRWDQMTLMLADCARKQKTPSALAYYSEETKEGKDEELRRRARTLAEGLIKELSDDELAALAENPGKEFPDDLILIELIKRHSSRGEYTEATQEADRFRDNFPASGYQDEFARFQRLLDRWLKVKPERIGVMLPLSGPSAFLGEQALKGIMLAAGVLDESRPEFMPELLIRDTGLEQAPIERMVEELADEEVIAIIGPLHKKQAERAGLKAQELGVPLLSLSPGEDLAAQGALIYQDCLTKTEQAQALAEYAVKRLGIKNFGVFYPGDDYGRDFLDLFSRAVAERGGTVTCSESYATTSTDFRSGIKALKAKREQHPFSALFIPDSWTRVAMITPQLRYMNMTGIKLLGANGWHSDQLLAQTQPADIEGAIFTDGIAPEAMEPAFNSFSRRYTDKFGAAPGLIESQAYEGMELILHLLSNFSLKNREQLRQSLDHIQDYPGILGEITIGADGKFQKPVFLLTIKENQFHIVSDLEAEPGK